MWLFVSKLNVEACFFFLLQNNDVATPYCFGFT